MYMTPTLNIGTLNVRGLRNQKNRAKKFRYIRQLGTQIICLQETNATPDDHSIFHKQCQAHQSFWTSHVAILSYAHDYELSNMTTISERIITAELRPKDSQQHDIDNILIIAIYAPARKSDRRQFYESLLSLPALNDMDTPKILLGDFNFDLAQSEGRSPYGRVIKTVFKNMHDEKATFHRQQTHSRLDYILVSPDLAPCMRNSTLINSPPSLTDHSALKLGLSIHTVARGPGWWKLNNSVLEDKPFQTLIENTLNFAFTNDGPFQSCSPTTLTSIQYEQLKDALRSACIMYCQRKAKVTRVVLRELQRELTNLSPRLHAPLSPDEQTRFEYLQWSLDRHWTKKLEGQAIRSRCKWREQGEKPTKYFFQTLRQRQRQSLISALTNPSTGKTEESPEAIRTIAHNFYSDLYTPEPVDDKHLEKMLSSIPNDTMREEHKTRLAANITKKELLMAIAISPNNKAPGLDGLSYEFYQTFRHTVLTDILAHQCHQALSTAVIPASWNRTATTLLFKKGSRTDLRNWRPIALINVDSKLFSRVLTTRLAEVVPTHIAQYQTGFVRGRYITDNAATVQLLMAHRAHRQKLGLTFPEQQAMVMLDQEKAYDRVHSSFLLAIMTRVGIPATFIQTIQSLFFQSVTHIVINGFLTNGVPQRRGLRQGDSLSPLLFNLVIEPFLRTIQQRLTGYRLSHTIKICYLAYADDVLLFINGFSDLNDLLQIYDWYAAASNARLNVHKTEALTLEDDKQKWQNIFPQMKWYDAKSAECPRYLGYPVSLQKRHHAWFIDSILQKMIRHANMLAARQLSLAGKALVINSLLTSKLWHVARLLPLDRHIKQINAILRKFFWQQRQPAIAWQTICQRKMEGGLGVIPVTLQAKALMLRHLVPLYVPDHPNRSFLHAVLEEIILQVTKGKSHWPVLIAPRAYRSLFRSFPLLPSLLQLASSVSFNLENASIGPQSFLDLPLAFALAPSKSLSQRILLTPMCHYLQGWPPNRHNIRPTHSSYGPADNRRLLLQNALTKQKTTWLSELAFPVDWQSAALDTDDVDQQLTPPLQLPELASKACFGAISLAEATTRDVRLTLANRDSNILQSRIPADCQLSFYTCLWRLPLSNEEKVVWWRLSINRISCRARMHRLFPTKCVSPACLICEHPEEDTDHLFFLCPVKQRFWKYVRVLMNLWISKDHLISLSQIHPQSIIEGFSYLWSPKSLRQAPTTMILLGLALHTIWTAHWHFVLRDKESGKLTYTHLVESMWHTLSNQICEETRDDKNSIWLRSGRVEWKDNKVLITRPNIYIPA